jgi:hypothetical protein
MIHSLSKLGTFEKCAAQYDYRYNKRLPSTKGPAAQRGIDNHALIERYIKGDSDELGEYTFYKSWLDSLRVGTKCIPEAKLALASDWSARDWEADDIWWRGVLDLLIPPMSPGVTAYVYDWKTGKIYPDHEDQREIYAIGAFCHYPDAIQVSCTHVYIDIKQQVKQDFHRDQLPAMQERWKRRFLALEGATEFPHNPQFSCRWCSYSRANGGPCPF